MIRTVDFMESVHVHVWLGNYHNCPCRPDCLNRGRMESLGNDDVSIIVHARK